MTQKMNENTKKPVGKEHVGGQSLDGMLLRETVDKCREAECKKLLAEILVPLLAPIREKREAVLAGDTVEAILRAGAERARAAAAETMTAVRRAMGV